MSKLLEDKFRLTDGERAHPLWLRLAAHLEQQLINLRGKNDGPLSEMETATLRGNISCLKSIIALGKAPPVIDGTQYDPRKLTRVGSGDFYNG